MENIALAIALSSIDFLNSFEKTTLHAKLKALESAGLVNPLEFLKSSSFGQVAALAERDKNRPLRVRRWDSDEKVRLAKKSALEAKAMGISFVLRLDPLYPPLLAEISDPPFALFYRGDISALSGKTVAVVGTRRLCPEARSAAHGFSYDASASGYCVVSGLALGADGAAHQGACDAFFDKKTACVKTAAVVAGGVDNVFPACHKKLAGKIIQNGGVLLSECPPGFQSEKWRFVSRNRIIAGLAPATVVIQAPPGSGALLTADFALGYNRELFFHQACFCKNALVLSGLVHKKLEAQGGAAAARKIETRPEAYVADGARVISSFEDFERNFEGAELFP